MKGKGTGEGKRLNVEKSCSKEKGGWVRGKGVDKGFKKVQEKGIQGERKGGKSIRQREDGKRGGSRRRKEGEERKRRERETHRTEEEIR